MKQKVLYVFFALTFLSGLLFFISNNKVSAETCLNTSSYGSVTLNIPELSDKNSRLIWVRMKAPEPSNKVLLQVNETDCLDLKTQDTNNWNWVTYNPEGSPKTMSFSSESGNYVKLIGVDNGVKVDRLLITSSDCVPTGFGTNCQGISAEIENDSGQAKAIQSKTPNPVSGKIIISETPAKNSNKLEELSYSSAGKILQKTDRADSLFNTILLPNGRHTVYVTTTLNNGQQITEYAEIDIKNSENPLTPTYRWFLLNRSSLLVVTLCIFIIGGVLLSARSVVNYARKKRERSFRGL